MGAQAALDPGAAILVSEWTFACAACGSPAVTWPADPTAEAPVACGGCARPLGTLAAFRAGIERVLAGHHARRDGAEGGRQETFEDQGTFEDPGTFGDQGMFEENRPIDVARAAPSS
ncbi:hypothetical protein [Methylorubrum thiocyanatum]|uniref:hypothetical protein n=1 Tax=Methylorubrum thiocyanatum TaxID=47958 RepID=UPI00398C69AA